MSSAGHYADLSTSYTGIGIPPTNLSGAGVPYTPNEPVPGVEPVLQLVLRVPENPKPIDFVRAYHKQVAYESEKASQEVLDAELAAANAERIAKATRAKAARLAEQVAALEQQIRDLS